MAARPKIATSLQEMKLWEAPLTTYLDWDTCNSLGSLRVFELETWVSMVPMKSIISHSLSSSTFSIAEPVSSRMISVVASTNSSLLKIACETDPSDIYVAESRTTHTKHNSLRRRSSISTLVRCLNSRFHYGGGIFRKTRGEGGPSALGLPKGKEEGGGLELT